MYLFLLEPCFSISSYGLFVCTPLFTFLLLFKILCGGEGRCTCEHRCAWKPEEGVGSSGATATSDELPHTVLETRRWQSSMCPKFSHLSIPLCGFLKNHFLLFEIDYIISHVPFLPSNHPIYLSLLASKFIAFFTKLLHTYVYMYVSVCS